MIKYIIAALTALMVVGCANTGAGNNIPLVWKPTTRVAKTETVDLTGRSDAKVRIEVTDNRKDDRGFIGRNTEKLPPRNVTTRDNVAAFVNDNLTRLISGTGLTEVDSTSAVLLKAEVLEFFVEETETYNGDVRLKVTLIDPSGTSIWTGIISGASTRFGRSYRAENYYETLSDSLVEAVKNLMRNAAFRSALEGVS